MASARKYLICFYCNKKSKVKYDGLISSWECKQCEATNFLDENGEVTEPPVATLEASPPDLTYSVSRSGSPGSLPSSQVFGAPPSYSPFCAKCLSNQDMRIKCMQQFHVEVDPSHPDYRRLEKASYKFQKTLDMTYPMYCKDCAPNVERGMHDAHNTSKSDFLRRSLAKSKIRVKKAAGVLTLARTRDFLGRSLWYFGLLAQLLWNVVVLSTIAEHHIKMASVLSYPTFVSELVFAVSSVSQFLPKGTSLGRQGLICSAVVFWWNPKFNNLNVGFIRHITGYKAWYKHQIILLSIRCLFYFVMGNQRFANSLESAVGAAHLFIFVFVIFLAIRAHSSIKVDYSRLYPVPRLDMDNIGPGSSPLKNGESMADAIKDLRVGSRLKRSPLTSSNTPYKAPFKPEPYIPGSISSGERYTGPLESMKELVVKNPRPPLPTFADLSTGNQQAQSALNQQYSGVIADRNLVEDSMSGDMDWSPILSQPKSQYRAFTDNLPVNNDAVFLGQAQPQQKTKLFGESPLVPESSPFWFKVPPAPIAPAHQLRNPPNQPRLRIVSQEQKQDLFSTSKSTSFIQENSEGTTSANGSQRKEIEFSQQKFFAPESPSPGHDSLVSAFGGWTITDSDDPQVVIEKSKTRNRHVGQAIALLLALVFWTQTLNHPSDYTKYIILAVLVGCFCIGARTILDNTYYVADNLQSSIDNAVAYTFGSLLGGAECLAALFGISWLSGESYGDIGTLGTVLTGGMLVHELWLLLL